MSESIQTETSVRRGRPPKNVDVSLPTSEETEVACPPAPSYPEKIVMTRPFGYIQDNGQGRMWFQKMVVDDPDEIKDIIDRGCRDWT